MNELNSAHKATILVVDDTSANLELMKNLLQDDYQVITANGGAKALKIAASASPPDLILLDIMMPGMDGYEVCRRLKRDRNTMNIPVVFLTAKSDVEDEKKGLELGAIDYITKPINNAIVLARVKNLLALKLRSSRDEACARRDWLKASLESMVAQLEQKLPEEQSGMNDREKLLSACARLDELLASNDAEALEVLDANAELLEAAFPDYSRKIDNGIRLFDFKVALDALRAAIATSAIKEWKQKA
ncbi:MAG: response regulator [Gallionella sp.]|nr:response regulator [Gallionella sp.]